MCVAFAEASVLTTSASEKDSTALSPSNMARPSFLVAEPEPAQALSTRKLILETAKFNVLTAHSSKEAAEIQEVSPSLSAMVVTADLPEAEKLIEDVKKARPGLIVIFLSPNQTERPEGVDHHLSSHDPESLVNLCRDLFGDPRKTQ
jgi:hypothetical protein